MREAPGSTERPLRVAIVGAGPAGFFTAEALLKQQGLACSVDIFDSLPTPYGLVRDGVAPDHQSIKKVAEKFERVAADPSVRFFGNVTFGSDVTRGELRHLYDQIVYAVGARTDRRMHIPGEALAGSRPATEFVGWYNGHPDFVDLRFDLGCERVVVVGNGNVAVDVVRILVRSPDELARTDIADYALAALRESRVREVVMLGRRGPAQAKFTNVELKELGQLEGVDAIVESRDLTLDPDSAAALESDRRAARNYEILQEMSDRSSSGAPRRIVFRFLASPVELIGDEGRVTAVRIERNRLVMEPDGHQRAEGTGETEVLSAGLVLRSVGYRGEPLPGLPFDESRGVIPSRAGRVIRGPGGEPVPGEYVAGWIKRGATGVIGTNKRDAAETVESMLADLGDLEPVPAERCSPETTVRLLENRDVRYVTFADWQLLDERERARGAGGGRPRVKYTRIDEMLEAIGR